MSTAQVPSRPLPPVKKREQCQQQQNDEDPQGEIAKKVAFISVP
jgi:hypothetical protein